MAKHQKVLDKLCKKPPAADVKWAEMKSLLEHLGYTMLKNSGSRRKFFHAGKSALIICHQPHPSPDVAKGCVADVAEHLRSYGFIK